MNFAYIYNEGARKKKGSVGAYFAFRSEPDNTCLIKQQLEMWLCAEQHTRIQNYITLVSALFVTAIRPLAV
jgi:hypothetical protein